MADPIYVVTLKNRDDLDGFYADMKSDGYQISLKRPISRNTHYHMTDLQAQNLRGDSRVLAVEKRAEDGIRDRSPSRGLGDVYKRQANTLESPRKFCA